MIIISLHAKSGLSSCSSHAKSEPVILFMPRAGASYPISPCCRFWGFQGWRGWNWSQNQLRTSKVSPVCWKFALCMSSTHTHSHTSSYSHTYSYFYSHSDSLMNSHTLIFIYLIIRMRIYFLIVNLYVWCVLGNYDLGWKMWKKWKSSFLRTPSSTRDFLESIWARDFGFGLFNSL